MLDAVGATVELDNPYGPVAHSDDGCAATVGGSYRTDRARVAVHVRLRICPTGEVASICALPGPSVTSPAEACDALVVCG